MRDSRAAGVAEVPSIVQRGAYPALALVIAVSALVGCAPAAVVDPVDDATAAFVEIKAGTFDMGCTSDPSPCDPDEVAHTVTLGQDYFIGVTEVTQAQFESVMPHHLATFDSCGGDCPVETVSWHESAAYTNALSQAAGATECYDCSGSGAEVLCDVAVSPYECDGYRLPTEAEWERAARCDPGTLFSGSDDVSAVAWHEGNSGGSPHAVGTKRPNGCGIYDLSGNVWEWTQDWYGSLSAEPATDPVGGAPSESRVNRGGGWDSVALYERVSSRHRGGPTARTEDFGFRVARSAPR